MPGSAGFLGIYTSWGLAGKQKRKTRPDISSRFSHVVRAEYPSFRRFCEDLEQELKIKIVEKADMLLCQEVPGFWEFILHLFFYHWRKTRNQKFHFVGICVLFVEVKWPVHCLFTSYQEREDLEQELKIKIVEKADMLLCQEVPGFWEKRDRTSLLVFLTLSERNIHHSAAFVRSFHL
jgi:hypothetical protein